MIIGNHTRMVSSHSPLTHEFFNALAGGVADSDKRHTFEALEQHGGMEHEKDAPNLSNDYVDRVLRLSSQGVGGLMGVKQDPSVTPNDFHVAVRDCSMRFNPDDSSNKRYAEYLENTPDGIPDNTGYTRSPDKLGAKFNV